uniref:Uncharacterized protein n=1 Tax=virus sp. ctEQ64 TaxID=2825809 RepID=A0A8S5RLK7_9VIRU|nr:MAG TPA: hypothetical protein [virus sp. ctEQ64]
MSYQSYHVPYITHKSCRSHLRQDNPFHQEKSTLCYEFNRYR